MISDAMATALGGLKQLAHFVRTKKVLATFMRIGRVANATFGILFTFRRLVTICRRLKNPCATAGNIAGLFTKCTYCKEYDRAFLDDPFVRRLRDQRQKRLGPRSLGFLARWLSRRGTILALVGHFLIIAKLEDHDIRVPILGMGREVAISRRIRILFITTTNLHDLPRTVLLAPLLDLVNCLGKSADEGRGDHCGCPYLATARPAAAARRSGSPPQGRRGFPSARK